MPVFLSQVKEALGLPSVPGHPSVPVPPVTAGSSQAPPIPVAVPAPASGAPPIVLEYSDSDADVHTLAVPFRSGSSVAYLPMVSTDESWSTDTEFRFVICY